MHNFKTGDDRNQLYLLPPSVDDWLEDNHLARFIRDSIDSIALMELYQKYREDGSGGKAYDPKMMLGILIYGYCLGERSSRKLESKCQTDIAYRFLSCNLKPDHTTISRFRKSLVRYFEKIFLQVLDVCIHAGLVKAGKIALDGTKIKANAALSSNKTKEHLRELVKRILKEADDVDAAEDALYGKDKRGDELPEELAIPEVRKAKIKQALEKIEEEERKEAEEKNKKVQEEPEPEKSDRKSDDNKKKQKNIDESDKKKINLTDFDSKIMKTRQSGYIQGYNAQAVVSEDQVILCAKVTNQQNDCKQLVPMVKSTIEVLKKVDSENKIEKVLADAGYWSEKNIIETESILGADRNLLVAVLNGRKQCAAMKMFSEIDMGAVIKPKDIMMKKLLSEEGKSAYSKRAEMIEGTFGQIKDGRGIRKFQLRGLEQTNGEWNLIALTHNLLKLWRKTVDDLKKKGSSLAKKAFNGLETIDNFFKFYHFQNSVTVCTLNYESQS